MSGSGTKDDPWQLTTAPGTSAYAMYQRFGMYLPPLPEELGLVELEHNARNNRARAR